MNRLEWPDKPVAESAAGQTEFTLRVAVCAWRNFRMLFSCAVLLGVPQTSPAWMCRPTLTISTNAATGAVSTNLCVGIHQLQAKSNLPNKPPGLKAQLYCFGLDVKDYAFYAVPYVIKNDRQTVICSSACLLAVLCVRQRSFRRSRRQQVLSSTPSMQTMQSAAPEAPTVTTDMRRPQLI